MPSNTHFHRLRDAAIDRDSHTGGICDGSIARREWAGAHGEYAAVHTFYPVLLVHDGRLGATGTGRFLYEEFRRALGEIPEDIDVHPLIVMSIANLEHLVGSTEDIGLRGFLHTYSVTNPERMRSVHNFLATHPEFADKVRPSSLVMQATRALADEAKELIHGRAPLHASSSS